MKLKNQMYIQYTVLSFLGRKQNMRSYILVERTHSWTENIVTQIQYTVYTYVFMLSINLCSAAPPNVSQAHSMFSPLK